MQKRGIQMEKDNTELKQLMKTLELAPCGVALFMTDTEEMIFVNEAYCRLLGYSKEE